MNIYEVAFDMSKQQATCSIRHSTWRMLQVVCCFDMLLVWTGLNLWKILLQALPAHSAVMSRRGSHMVEGEVERGEIWPATV